MVEGSVQVDGGSLPSASQSQGQGDQGGQSSDTGDTGVKKTDGAQGAEGDQSEGTQSEGTQGDTGEQGEQTTDKGTKLDPNPQSAVHQKLANAERLIGDFKKVLGSPELLRK